MKKIIPLLLFAFLLTACDGFGVQPQPFPVWTAIPSGTPSIFTVTPIILNPGEIATQTSTQVFVPTLEPTFTPVTPPTDISPAVPVQSVAVDILGCNTGLDVMHGMGEVTNAYVTVKNTGSIDLPNACALLRAIDEGREHPDKKVCVTNLPAQNQVTLKLTVDSTYKEGTIIQVDASSNDSILLRVDKPSCTDIDLFGGAPSDLGVVKGIE